MKTYDIRSQDDVLIMRCNENVMAALLMHEGTQKVANEVIFVKDVLFSPQGDYGVYLWKGSYAVLS